MIMKWVQVTFITLHASSGSSRLKDAQKLTLAGKALRRHFHCEGRWMEGSLFVPFCCVFWFCQFCHIQKQWVVFSSTSFCLSFSLFPSIQNMQEWCDESKRGVKPEAWHHFAFFVNGSCCCGWWCDVTWRDVTWCDVMWCVIKLDLMPLTFLGLAIVVANLKLLGQIAICSMYLNVLRREARATSDWRPRPWNIQIQMESAVAEFSTSFAKLQLFVSFCQACSSFSTTL